MAAASMSSAEILRRTTSFLSRVLAQPDVRHRLLSTFCRRIWPADQDLLKAFKIAAETLENAASTSNPSVGSSSLRLAEKLLLSKSTKCTSLSFLLSLIYSLCHQPINAALSLLDIFSQDPSLARSEVAPSLFEELFLVHLIPVLQWFSDERSRIFSSSVPSPSITDANGEFSCDFSVVVPSEKLLSSMSGDQAAKLKELEGNYEEAINENCRVLSEYFKEVLRDKDGGRGLKHNPPSAILEKKQNNDGPFGSQSGNVNGNGNGRAMEKSRTEELRIKNGRQYGLKLKDRLNTQPTGPLSHLILKGSPPNSSGSKDLRASVLSLSLRPQKKKIVLPNVAALVLHPNLTPKQNRRVRKRTGKWHHIINKSSPFLGNRV
ncbi:hypothetical protein CRG98_042980, partial [Punica granatum]